MTEINLCRLCSKTFKECKRLYDENGQCNDLYNWTCKYFHPEIINLNKAKHLTAICLQCWRQITDFQMFQITVRAAQSFFCDYEQQTNINKLQNTNRENILDDSSNDVLHEDHMTYGVDIKYFNNFGDEEQERLTALGSGHGAASPNDFKDTQFVANPLNIEVASNDDDNNEDDQISMPTDDDQVSSSDDEDYEQQHSFNKKPFEELTCNLCNISFANIYNLRCHAKNKHPEETHTLDQTANMAAIDDERDQRIAKWIPSIKCVACSDHFAKYSEYRQHFHQHHIKKKFFITCCKRKFFVLWEIEDHILLHNDPNAFNCLPCKTSYANRAQLKRHIKNKHAEVVRQSASKKEIDHECDQQIAKWMPNIKCVACSAIFIKYSLYRQHFQQHHSQDKCFIKCCKRKLFKPCHIKQHILIHNKYNRLEHSETIGGVGGLYKCQECEEVFSLAEDLSAHCSSRHSDAPSTSKLSI